MSALLTFHSNQVCFCFHILCFVLPVADFLTISREFFLVYSLFIQSSPKLISFFFSTALSSISSGGKREGDYQSYKYVHDVFQRYELYNIQGVSHQHEHDPSNLEFDPPSQEKVAEVAIRGTQRAAFTCQSTTK